MTLRHFVAVFITTTLVTACSSGTGPAGAQGPAGTNGTDGTVGMNGTNGMNGANGSPGANGNNGTNAVSVLAEDTPLSGVVAVNVDESPYVPPNVPTLVSLVESRVAQWDDGTLPTGVQFPLVPATTDTVRSIRDTRPHVLVKWLDPLAYNGEQRLADGGVTSSRDPRLVPRFGANPDYIAYLGDGWEDGGTPFFQGSSTSGWLWVNHEYVSNERPLSVSTPDGGSRFFAPSGQHLTLATFNRVMRFSNIDPTSSTPWADADLNDYVKQWKKHVGGSWMRIVKDEATSTWSIDLSAPNRRFDGTSNTLAAVTGHMLGSTDSDDTGLPLGPGVIAGTNSNCAGGLSPWGTIFSGEENTQFSFGDLEAAYSSTNLFLGAGHGFVPGNRITFPYAPVPLSALTNPGAEGSFAAADSTITHSREMHGWIAEFDPTVRPDEFYGRRTPGIGQRKIGGLGRARWEAAAVAVDSNWRLVPNQPITLYAADDRRNGRIYKYVSGQPYTAGMTKAQTRALLDSGGKLYVAHFENMRFDNGEVLVDGGVPLLTRTANDGYALQSPGGGRWVELSTTSTDIAPNAAPLGMPTMTVGQALTSNTWNGIAGFGSDDDVRRALHTAANKIGVSEMNRPEDLEWNPVDPTGTPALYVTFTGHGQPTSLTQDGRLATQPPLTDGGIGTENQGNRAAMRNGAIYAIRETGGANPAVSRTFTAFAVWRGVGGSNDLFAAAMPDNLLIARNGSVWFGTDGNPGRNNGRADAIYYLDLNATHSNAFGKAFRVVTMPSDAEATGPFFSPDQRTLFISVQHPGEEQVSTWPRRMP
jgi:uncharacterized protein